MRGDSIDLSPGFEPARPTREEGYANPTFVDIAFVRSEPSVVSPAGGTVIGEENDDRVVVQAQPVELREQTTDVVVD